MWEPDGCRWDLAFSRHSSLVTCHCSSDLGLRTFLLVTRHSSLVTALMAAVRNAADLTPQRPALRLLPQVPSGNRRPPKSGVCASQPLTDPNNPPSGESIQWLLGPVAQRESSAPIFDCGRLRNARVEGSTSSRSTKFNGASPLTKVVQ